MVAIQEFIAQCIIVKEGASVKTTDVAAEYVRVHGSTEGKIKLYRALQGIAGVTKTRTTFEGMKIKLYEEPVVKKNTTVDNGMTAYQKAKLELEQQRLERQERIEQQRLDQEKELKKGDQELKKGDQELERQRLEQEKELKQQELESQERMKQLDRDFMREENNKNRKMYVGSRFNKYLDLQVYGSPSQQYILTDSLSNVLEFQAFDITGDIEHAPQIKSDVENVSEQVSIIENGLTKTVSAVPISKTLDLLDTMPCDMPVLTKQVELIPDIAIKDDNRHIQSTYDIQMSMQDTDAYPTMMDKDKYLRVQNKVQSGPDGEIMITCYTCGKLVPMKSSACHRMHVIPKSKGGDCSINNIVLGCATCNQDTGNKYTALEYKVHLYAKLVNASDKTFTAD